MWSQDSCGTPIAVVVGEQEPEGSRRQRVNLGGLKVHRGSSQWETPYHFNNHLLSQEPPQWGLELLGRRNKGS